MTLPYKFSEPKAKDDKLITLNVSGRRFVTWESTLKKHPKTLLGGDMLSVFFDKKYQEYFIDRDPHMFRYILNFYRAGKLHASSEDCNLAFKDELDFFGICSTEMEHCCWEDDEEVCNSHKEKSSAIVETFGIRRKYLWMLLEASDTSWLGKAIQSLLALTICMSIIFSVLETVHYGKGMKFQDKFPDMFEIVELVCIVVFSLEYLLRLYASENRLKFLVSKMSIIDLMAFMPFYVDLVVNKLATDKDIKALRNLLGVFRVLRIVRMLKLSRNFRHMRVVGHMLKVVFVDLGFLLFGFFLLNLMFSTLMFYIEYDEGKGNFTSIPNTMWYTVVTMMTIGYGDMVPVTAAGKIFGSLCCLMGILMLALPTTMIQRSTCDNKRNGMNINVPNKTTHYKS